MRDSFLGLVSTMLPSFVSEAIGVLLLRVALEFALPRKHESTPGRIVSAVHSLFCGYWISESDWQSAIAATLLYFVYDAALNFAFQEHSSKFMLIHHILGAVLCYAAIHFQLWKGETPAAAITNSLIMMETTSLTVQAAFIAYYEFEYAALMTPALIHFVVVRVICVGQPILKHYDYLTQGPIFLFCLYGVSCVLWVQQIVWAFLWTQRLLAELCTSLDEVAEKNKAN